MHVHSFCLKTNLLLEVVFYAYMVSFRHVRSLCRCKLPCQRGVTHKCKKAAWCRRIKLYLGLTRFYAFKINVPWAASSMLDITIVEPCLQIRTINCVRAHREWRLCFEILLHQAVCVGYLQVKNCPGPVLYEAYPVGNIRFSRPFGMGNVSWCKLASVAVTPFVQQLVAIFHVEQRLQ